MDTMPRLSAQYEKVSVGSHIMDCLRIVFEGNMSLAPPDMPGRVDSPIDRLEDFDYFAAGSLVQVDDCEVAANALISQAYSQTLDSFPVNSNEKNGKTNGAEPCSNPPADQ